MVNNLFIKRLCPYLLYAKNELLIERIFDPTTKLIKLISIEK